MINSDKTLIIFAYECAPYHKDGSSIGAQRPYQFAKYLKKFGWKTVVLCCDKSSREINNNIDKEKIKKSISLGLKDLENNNSAIIPLPSLKYDGIIDLLWKRVNNLVSRQKWMSPILKLLTFIKLNWGDYSQSWQPVARYAAKILSEEKKISICLGEHGPDAGIFLARWYSKKYGIPWVADFRDPVLMPFTPLTEKFYKPIIKRLLKSCVAVINVNPVWSRWDSEMFNKPTYCITNGFDPDEFITEKNQELQNKYTILYGGNFYEFQPMDAFFQGISLANQIDSKLMKDHFLFAYYGLGFDRVKRMAKKNNISELVDVTSFVTREKLISKMKNGQQLLLLTAHKAKNKYFSKGFYPGKVFEYFGARREILAFPGDNSILDDLVLNSAGGVIIRSSDQLAEFLVSRVNDWRKKKLNEVTFDDQFVNKFTRENQTKVLAGVLDSCLNEINR